MNAEIFILNYKGGELLPKCLPSIVKAADKSSFDCEVTILNNPSDSPDQEGKEYTQSQFPKTKWVQAPENKILCSYNDYLKNSHADVVILLNNDIRVDENFMDPLINGFKQNAKAFLVAPKVMSFDGSSVEAGASRAGFKFGMFWCESRYQGFEEEVEKAGPTFSSGFGAFDRKKFLELGGYWGGFQPGIMEDVDLCYRGAKRGFDLNYEPKSVVFHMGQASFKEAYGDDGIQVLAHRNTFLFIWNRWQERGDKIKHFLWLPFRIVYALLRGQKNWLRGLLQACQSQFRLEN